MDPVLSDLFGGGLGALGLECAGLGVLQNRLSEAIFRLWGFRRIPGFLHENPLDLN